MEEEEVPPTQGGLAQLEGLEALLQTAVATGQLLLLPLQLRLQLQVLLSQSPVTDQRPLLVLLDLLHLQRQPTVSQSVSSHRARSSEVTCRLSQPQPATNQLLTFIKPVLGVGVFDVSVGWCQQDLFTADFFFLL